MLSKQVVWSVFSSLAVVASAFAAVHGEPPGEDAAPEASASLVLAGTRAAPAPAAEVASPSALAPRAVAVAAPLLGGHAAGNGTGGGNGSSHENTSPQFTPTHQLVVGQAGVQMEYVLVIENPADVPQNVSIGFAGPATWQMSISPTSVILGPGESVSVVGKVRTLSTLLAERDTLDIMAWGPLSAEFATVDICARALLQDPCAGQNSTHPRTNDTQPPGNDTRPPTNDTQPPGNDTRPPTNDTRPPGNDTRPPTNDSSPPGNDSRPPVDRQLPPIYPPQPPEDTQKPPTNDTRPPQNETQPPSNETAPRESTSARVDAEVIVGGRRAQNEAYLGPKNDGGAHPEV